jgi:predicted ATP-dependent protease
MRIIILNLVFIFFTSILSAQTVIQKQKTDKQYHSKSIKKPNTKNSNLIKVQEESISTEFTDEIKQNQVTSNPNTKSAKVKIISPTIVVPNTTQRKDVKPSKSKYQRKEIKIKEVKDE